MFTRTCYRISRTLGVERLERRDAPALAAVGPEFQVNSFISGSQYGPSVAIDADGDFVVTWTGLGQQDGNSAGVFAQRFSADGARAGNELRVNGYSMGDQFNPSVAMDADGEFVIVWTDRGVGGNEGLDGSGYGVYARRFNSFGFYQGNEFRINSTTISNQTGASVAMNAGGAFVVTWYGAGAGTDAEAGGIYAQRFDASGNPQGGEFQVNTYTTNQQLSPVVGMNAAGDFVVAWTSSDQDGSGYGIFARRFNAAGVAQGGEFPVNTQTAGSQHRAAIAMNGNGDFVITWNSNIQDGSLYDIYAQSYSAAGEPIGPETKVNQYTTSQQLRSSVGVDAGGNFTVAWQSLNQDGSGYGVFARSFDALAAPVSDEFQVNSFTSNSQTNPWVVMSPIGDVVVAWTSYYQDGSARGVFAQRYEETGLAPVVRPPRLNDGSLQRSRITELFVPLSQPVTFAGPIADAFTLTRTGGGPVAFSASSSIVNGVTVVTLNSFIGPETEFGSLRDGRYTLTALASQISANGQQMSSNYTFNFHRFYGDMNGDSRVDISDFGFFSLAFYQPLNYNAALDFNNDGRIDIADFGQFSVRFFTTLP